MGLLAPLGDLFQALGLLGIVLVAGALVTAYRVPKSRQGKAALVGLVLLIMSWFPGRMVWDEVRARSRLRTAEAMFQERCKTAGVKIYRTAENVEGLFLMKLRPERINYGENEEEQFRLDDPYGRDSTENEYLKSFLARRNQNGYLTFDEKAPSAGYRYVEALDPKDGKRYRYTGRIEEPWQLDKHYLKGYTRFVLDKAPAGGDRPRYGVTYDDISTREEREYWIAGSSLKVIDLKTNEVMAERIGYMMDPGQGNRGGGRAPWLMAASNACPTFPTNGGHTDQIEQTRNFVEKALKPIQEK